jgi:sRNA-binding carbon storage regulator CsrA
MLILTRKAGTWVTVPLADGTFVTFKIMKARSGGNVSVGIEAPPHLSILRGPEHIDAAGVIKDPKHQKR